MTKFEEYKNKILDIQYIFSSNIIDLIDYQYIIALIHESIYIISKELLPHLKIVLNNISLTNVDQETDLMNCNTYIYLLNMIKENLNTFDNISPETEQQLYDILERLDKITTQNLTPNEEIAFVNDNQSNCIQNCFECSTKCNINNMSSPALDTLTFQELEENQTIEKNIKQQNIIQYQNNNLNNFNPKYIKDYLLYNNLLYNECAICGLKEWQNNYLQMEIDFIDGNKYNQNIENIRLLCPNCYSQVGYCG